MGIYKCVFYGYGKIIEIVVNRISFNVVKCDISVFNELFLFFIGIGMFFVWCMGLFFFDSLLIIDVSFLIGLLIGLEGFEF